MSDDLYMDAPEAAEALGISVPTLYSYVSRKGLRSFAVPGTRRRRYWRADILALLASFEPQGGEPPAPSTRITLLTATGTYYRGHDVVDLADRASVEDVAALLWQAPADQIFTDRLPHAPLMLPAMLAALQDAPTLDRAMSMLPLIERANPRAFDLSPAGFAASGADALRWLTALILGADAPSPAPVHRAIADTLGADLVFADLIRRALILIADHEFAATTHAVRAAASTGLTPYAAVLVGLVAATGQKAKIQRYEAVRRLVLEILGAADPAQPIISRFRAGEDLAGFETLPMHRGGDRRAQALLSACRAGLVHDPLFQRLETAVGVVTDLTSREPGVIVLLAFLGHRLGLAGNELALGTIGRAIGWIAHAQEAMAEPMIGRSARASYDGPLPTGTLERGSGGGI